MAKKKFCKYCGTEKILTDFYPTSHSSDGYMNKCKECSKAYSRQYHRDNADKIRKKHREYYEKNIDKIKAYDKKRYWENRDEVLAKCAEYKAKHSEEMAAYSRRYRLEHREKILERERHPNKKRLERKREYAREYYYEHKDRINKRKAEKDRTDTIYHLKRQTRGMIRRSFNRKNIKKSKRTEEVIGCSLDFFIEYLKKTWYDRYKEEWSGQPCHIDHITPLILADTPEDVAELCHYTNLQLLKPEDNLRKSAKV